LHPTINQTILIFDCNDGPHLLKLTNYDTFCEHPLKGTDVAFKAAHNQFITDLISSLDKFLDTTPGVFQATHVAKFSSWPSAGQDILRPGEYCDTFSLCFVIL